MLITLAILCIGQILRISAEEISNTDNKNVTDDIQEYKVSGNIPRPPITLRIIPGKPKEFHPERAKYGVRVNPLLYSNFWKPLPLPTSTVRNLAEEQKEYYNYRYYPFIHSYPQSLLNSTSPFSNYSESSIALKDTTSVPSGGINPLFFNPILIQRRPENIYATYMRKLQNASDSVSRPVVSKPEVMDFINNRRYYPSTVGGFPTFPIMPSVYMPTGSNQNIYPANPYPAFTPPYIPMYSNVRNTETEILGSRNKLYDNTDREEESDKIEKVQISDPSSSSVEISSTEIASGRLAESVSPSFPKPNIISSAVPIDNYRYGILPALVQDLLPRIVSASNPIPYINNIPENTGYKMSDVPFSTETKLILDSSNNATISTDAIYSDANTNMDSQVNEDNDTTNGTVTENKISYHFGFDMNDGKGTDQHRKEISDTSGVVTGSYGYRDMFGVYRIVNYIADKNGFRAVIKSNEPGLATSGSAGVVVIAEKPPSTRVAAEMKVLTQDPNIELQGKQIVDEDTDKD